jgi:hypothetical protein
VWSHAVHREDRLTRAEWDRLKQELGDRLPVDGPAFRDAGINHASMLSPPLLVWDLSVPTTARNAPVCEFHNLAEGHAAVFCEDIMKEGLSSMLSQQVECTWTDRSLWSLSAGGCPRFPRRKLADMTGVEKEVVAKHADVFLWRFFREDVDERGMWAYFKEGLRGKLGCRLLGVGYENYMDNWRKRDWKEFFGAHGGVPWRRFYTEYICNLSRMMRELSSVYQTRSRLEEGGELDRLVCTYIQGTRLALGKQFWSRKSILHRVRHLLLQGLGESLVLVIRTIGKFICLF